MPNKITKQMEHVDEDAHDLTDGPLPALPVVVEGAGDMPVEKKKKKKQKGGFIFTTAMIISGLIAGAEAMATGAATAVGAYAVNKAIESAEDKEKSIKIANATKAKFNKALRGGNAKLAAKLAKIKITKKDILSHPELKAKIEEAVEKLKANPTKKAIMDFAKSTHGDIQNIIKDKAEKITKGQITKMKGGSKTKFMKDVTDALVSKLPAKESKPKEPKQTGGSCEKKINPWLAHVKSFRCDHPQMSYKDVLKNAKATYKKE